MAYTMLSTPPTDLMLRTVWYVYIRWFILLAISAPGLLSLYIGEGFSSNVQRDTLLALAAIASNGLFFGLIKLGQSTDYYRVVANIMLNADIALITYLVFTKGGVESRSPILYVIPILMSAAIFGRMAVYRTALVSVAAYSALIVADFSGSIHTIGAANPAIQNNYPYMINTVTFFASALFVVAAVADFLTRLLIEKERQASANAEGLKRAQALAGLGSWEWDTATDAINCSEEMFRALGLKPQKLDFRNYIKRVHPEDKEKVSSLLLNARDTCLPFSFDHRIIQPNRTIRFIHTEGRPMGTGKCQSKIMICTNQDLTAERALDKAKDEFVSLASHQLRTPATGVKTYLSMLLDDFAGKLTPKQRRFLKQAHNANERQLHIIDSLLSVASIESGRLIIDKVPTNLAALVESVITDHTAAFRSRKQSIEIVKPERPIIAGVDPNRFRMVLDNLLSNACKYTHKGGTIVVKLSRKGGKASIEVKDNGVGIAKKDLSDLFLKFSRAGAETNSKVEGTGLGLYISKYIVVLHGGKILVNSRPGHGSAFTIEIALHSPRRATVAAKRKSELLSLNRLKTAYFKRKPQ